MTQYCEKHLTRELFKKVYMDGRRVTTKRVIRTSSKQQNASGSLLLQIGWEFNIVRFFFL